MPYKQASVPIDALKDGEMSIGVGIFLMVLGAVLAFAVEATTSGINVNTLGIILLLIGLVAVLYSLLFWSNLSLRGRRRTVARRRTVVEERPVEVIEERPVEVIEERPLDDGLP
jgi:membrane protein implicated in regulation of membrane protease activity